MAASRVDGASETSPLLGEQRKPSLHHGRGPLLADDDDDDDDQRGLLSRKTKKRTVTASKVCCYGLLALLAATGVALAVVHVWIGNLVNRTDSMLAMAERGFVWEGPYDVRFDDRGAQVDVAVAFDVRKALNWSAGSKRERFEHRVAARIVSRTPYAFVDVPSLYFDSPEGTLAETSTSLRVPLFYNNVRLTNTTVDLPFEVYPALKEYAIDVYERRKWRVRLNIVDLFVQPQGKGFLGWIAKRVGTTTISALAIEQSGHLPSLPSPDDLVDLRTVTLDSEANETMSIYVDATVKNPVRSLPSPFPRRFAFSVPYRLPVSVSVPTKADGNVEVARVMSNPFRFEAFDKHSLVSAEGSLLKPPVNVSLSKTISSFVRKYLDGKNSTVRLTIGHSDELPDSIDSLLFNTTAEVTFPGATEGVELFRDLTIRGMHIALPSIASASAGAGARVNGAEEDADLLCSGTLSAQLVLPPTFASLHPSLNISELSPDVYIYDGDLPPYSPRYPPSMPPANAFARLSPRRVGARTFHPLKNETLIEATFDDAPLRLIPGREGVFRRYVAKVIFAGPQGVKTSVRGVSDARVAVRGWTEFDLGRLAVQGTFNVKRDGVDSSLSLF